MESLDSVSLVKAQYLSVEVSKTVEPLKVKKSGFLTRTKGS